MAEKNHEAVKRLFQRFFREELAQLRPDERQEFEQEFEQRFEQLLQGTTGEGKKSFIDLIGFGAEGVQPFGDIPHPRLKADFDEAVIPTQLHAARRARRRSASARSGR